MRQLASCELDAVAPKHSAIPTIPVGWLNRYILPALAVMLALPLPARAQAPNLGSAANFAVLAGSAISNTGSTVLLGSLGISPGSAVTGFPPGLVVAPGGVFVSDAVAIQAQIDLALGYNAIAGRPATADLTGQDLGGQTLTPGVYNFASSAQLTGTLRLNALGNPNAIFIFNIGSTLTTSSGSSVTVIGGGLGSNVYWRVGSSATLGTTSAFVGDILALTSITLTTGANITCGSALARNGAVILDTNTIAIRNLSSCAVAPLVPTAPGTTTPPVAGAIDAAFIDAVTNNNNTLPAGFPQAFLGLAGLSPELLALALQQLAGEGSTGVAPAGIQAMNSFLSLVLHPFGGNLMSGNRRGFGPAEPAMIVKAPLYGSKAPGYPSRVTQPWSIWAAAYGAQGQADGSSSLGTHDRTVRAAGFATGLDYRVTYDTIVGFALGGGGTRFGVAEGLGGGRSDLFQAAIYGSTRINAAYVSAALAYSWYDITTDQYMTVLSSDRLTAKFDANNVGGRIESGYRLTLPGLYTMQEVGLTPYGALQGQAFISPSYSESATSAFARSYDGRTSTAVRAELGVWMETDYRVFVESSARLTLRSRVAWAHDWVSEPRIGSRFLALPAANFTVEGAAIARDLALVSTGVELRLANGFSVGAQFDSELADRATSYGGTGRVRYTW